jgi:hypothetical protein
MVTAARSTPSSLDEFDKILRNVQAELVYLSFLEPIRQPHADVVIKNIDI